MQTSKLHYLIDNVSLLKTDDFKHCKKIEEYIADFNEDLDRKLSYHFSTYQIKAIRRIVLTISNVLNYELLMNTGVFYSVETMRFCLQEKDSTGIHTIFITDHIEDSLLNDIEEIIEIIMSKCMFNNTELGSISQQIADKLNR